MKGARPPHVPSTALGLHYIVAAQPLSKLEAEWCYAWRREAWFLADCWHARPCPLTDMTQNPAAPATETHSRK